MGEAVQLFTSLADDFDAAISAYLDFSRAKNLSERTITFYSERLTDFQRFAEKKGGITPHTLTPPFIREWMSDTLKRNSPTTANHNLRVLRMCLKFLVDDGFLLENVATKVGKVREDKKVIPTFSQEQVQAMLRACPADFYGVRDKTILLTLLDTGMRISELISLELDDLFYSEHLIRIKVRKGRKEQSVPFGVTLQRQLQAYLRHRGNSVATNVLFVNHFGEHMDRGAIRWMMKRRAKTAGVTGVRVSPHTFRHTFAKMWLINGGDIFSLQKILGHTTLDMVKIYLNLVQSEVQSMHKRFSPADNLPTEKIGRTRVFGRKKQ